MPFASIPALAIALTILSPGAAQAQSSIATDDTLAGVAAEDLSGPNYEISDTHGVRVGDNRFHSFDRFGLATGETATFTSASAGIKRLIARVTGGSPSPIDGPVRSEIDGASLYLLNPNGIVFSENGSLDIRGDVVLSTADYVELGGSEGIFDATTPSNSILSPSAVSKFGFLSSSPAGIQIEGGRLETVFLAQEELVGASLSLIGGNIEIRGTGEQNELTYLYSRGGRINLASLGSSGTVTIVEGAEPGLLVEATGELGDIFVGNRATVVSGGPPPNVGICLPSAGCVPANGSGDIFVRGRDLRLEDGEIRALNVTDRDGGTVDVELTGDLVASSLSESETTGIFAISGLENTFPGTEFFSFRETIVLPEGPYEIRYARELGTENITRIAYPGTGDAGDIRIRARNVTVSGAAQISTEAIFGGDAGTIDIVAEDTVAIDAEGRTGEFGSIITNAANGGSGGALSIRAQDLIITDNGRILSEVRNSAGDGGAITIEVDRLVATGDGRIDSSTRGDGSGGSITVVARESVRLSGQENEGTFSGISTLSQPDGDGDAGSITVTTPSLRIDDGAQVTTTAFGTGNAGVLDIRTAELRLDRAEIRAESETGLGGDIYINGGPLTVEPDGGLSFTAPDGVAPGDLLFLRDSDISTSVNGGSGQGGDISIATANVILVGSQIRAQAVDGAGGNMRIEANAVLTESPRDIDATSRFSQDGTVEITSPTVDIRTERPDLPSNLVDPATLLRERCAARSGAASISLVLRNRSGLQTEPDGLLAAGIGDSTSGLTDIQASTETWVEAIPEVRLRSDPLSIENDFFSDRGVALQLGCRS